MPQSNIIETIGLEKRYKSVVALDGLSLAVPPGSIFGLLGKNGAGKTTAIKILMGLIRPTAGSATIFGLPTVESGSSVAIRQRTGFLDDERDLYDFMTVAQLIAFTASFFPNWRADLAARYLRDFDLPPPRRVKALSRGGRTKLALLLAFCRGAELLILDEATSGLDPLAVEEVLQVLVRHVANEGATVFFSSHHIAEVEQVADHIAIIDRGRQQLGQARWMICVKRTAVSSSFSMAMRPRCNFKVPESSVWSARAGCCPFSPVPEQSRSSRRRVPRGRCRRRHGRSL